jgi:serine protease Do
MKNFALLLLAAVLGSALTFTASQKFGSHLSSLKYEGDSGILVHTVAYNGANNGEGVPLDFGATAEKVMPAVVHIKSTQERPVSSSNNDNNPFGGLFPGASQAEPGPRVGTGSGVIINAGGYIVTNNHVVQGADIIEVTLPDTRTFKAEVIGTDKDTDIALIKINQKNLPFLSFVNSDNAHVGEWVLAVGNPFNLNSTVTAGIISAKGRSINIIGRDDQNGNSPQTGNTAIESFIQTDAAINPGNSGGALVDLNGGLIGINTALASQTGTYIGYGFAVPSNIVSKVVEDLIAYGTVQRGWLGVSIQNVTSDLAKIKDLSEVEGAYVVGFGDKSAARDSGIKEGDVIVKLDETEIKSSTAVTAYIGSKHPGDKVSITVNRKGETIVIPVVLKNKEGNTGTVRREEKDAFSSLGLTMEEANKDVLKQLDLQGGVKVKLSEDGRIARYTEMHDGFIITRLDETPVKSTKEVEQLLKEKKPGDLVTFSGVYSDYPREYIYALRM